MAARRGHGEGSIFKRADGQWVGRIELGRDADGRRLRKTVYGRTKVLLLEKMGAAAELKRKDLPQVDTKTTVSQWLTTWLDGKRLSEGSRVTYAATVTNYIVPAIGSKRLVRLSVADVEAMTAGLMARGLAVSTARQAQRVLSVALNAAMRADALHRNVAALAEAPSGRTETRAELALTADQAEAVIAAAKGDRLAAVPVVLFGLGIRKGELLALRWDDVTLDGKDPSLTIAASLSRVVGHGLVRGWTKTKGSERTIPLPADVVAALKAHRKAQRAERLKATVWADDGIVFASPIGTYIDPRNLHRAWHTWTAAAGLGKRRVHASRHTTATLLLARGVPLEVVSAILGHTSIGLTAGTYAKVRSDAIRKALGS